MGEPAGGAAGSAGPASPPRLRYPFGPAAAHLVALAGWAAARGPAFNDDAVAYEALARCLLAGDLEHFRQGSWSPAFPAVLAPFVALGLEVYTAGLLVAAAAGLAALGLLSRLGRALGLPDRAARLAAWGLALCPLWVAHSTWTTPDILAAAGFLFFLPRLAGLSRDPSPGRGACAGALAGALFWVRAFLLPLGIIALPIALAGAPRGRRLPAALAYGGALAAAAAPWVLAMSLRYGRLVVSSTALMAQRENVTKELLRTSPDQVERFYVPTGPWNLIDYYPPGSPLWEGPAPEARMTVAHQLRGVVTHGRVAARALLNPGYGAILLLALVGLAAAAPGVPAGPRLRVAALAAAFVASYAFVAMEDRYLFPIFPPVFLLAGLGVVALARIPSLRSGLLALWAAATLVQGARRVEETRRLQDGARGAAYRETARLLRAAGGGRIGVATEGLLGEPAAIAAAQFSKGEVRLVAIVQPDARGAETLRARGVRWAVARQGQPACVRLLASAGFVPRRTFSFDRRVGFELWERGRIPGPP